MSVLLGGDLAHQRRGENGWEFVLSGEVDGAVDHLDGFTIGAAGLDEQRGPVEQAPCQQGRVVDLGGHVDRGGVRRLVGSYPGVVEQGEGQSAPVAARLERLDGGLELLGPVTVGAEERLEVGGGCEGASVETVVRSSRARGEHLATKDDTIGRVG